jgi:beta-galactosidase
MAYCTLARGADGLLFFRYRTCAFGAEAYWCGILDHDNVPRRRYDEVSRLGKELATIGPLLLGTSVHVDVAVAAADLDNTEAHNSLSLGLPTPWQVSGELHEAFYRRGHAVGCVHPEDNLDRLKLYIVPHWVIVKPEWLPALRTWVENGGVLVLGARTGTRDADNNVLTLPVPGYLRSLTGVTVVDYGRQNQPDGRPLDLELGDQTARTEHWYEQLELDADTRALALWTRRHLKGTAAISLREVGKGKVIYVGSYLTGALRELLVPELVKLANLSSQCLAAPPEVEVVQRRCAAYTLWFLMNHADHSLQVEHPPLGRDCVTGSSVNGALSLPAYGVAVIQSAETT